MGRLPRLCGLFLCLSCAGQSDSTAPCVRTLDVIDAPTVIVNSTATIRATVKNKSGKCSGSEPVSWSSSNTASAEIVSSTDSTAVVRGKAAGKPTIVAFLTRIPSVRDSILLTVALPVDAMPLER